MKALNRISGFTWILIATVISGLAGYLIIWLVGRALGAADYQPFAVFWATMFLIVGGLSGVQNEIARAARLPDGPAVLPDGAPTAPGTTTPRPANPALFGLWTALAVVALGAASAPFWGPAVFADSALAVLPALLVGVGFYVLFAVACGVLYGANRWLVLAVVIALDSIFRLILIGIALLVDPTLTTLSWAAALPYPLTLIVFVIIALPRVRGVVVDVDYRGLSWNLARTVAAATATALLISGFPMLLELTNDGASAAQLGALTLAISLSRAPLVVTSLSLQSYLIVLFRDRWATRFRALLQISAALIALTAVLTALAWAVGEPVLVWLFDDSFRVPGWYLAALVASSLLTAGLFVVGAAVLAADRHGAYAAGFVAAAAVGILVLALGPGDASDRAVWALTLGPLVGLLVQLAALITDGRSARPAAAQE